MNVVEIDGSRKNRQVTQERLVLLNPLQCDSKTDCENDNCLPSSELLHSQEEVVLELADREQIACSKSKDSRILGLFVRNRYRNDVNMLYCSQRESYHHALVEAHKLACTTHAILYSNTFFLNRIQLVIHVYQNHFFIRASF